MDIFWTHVQTKGITKMFCFHHPTKTMFCFGLIEKNFRLIAFSLFAVSTYKFSTFHKHLLVTQTYSTSQRLVDSPLKLNTWNSILNSWKLWGSRLVLSFEKFETDWEFIKTVWEFIGLNLRLLRAKNKGLFGRLTVDASESKFYFSFLYQ